MITTGNQVTNDLELTAEVCVIGSGAGGAVVARQPGNQRQRGSRRWLRLAIPRILRVELALPSRGDDRLRGTGLVVVNPPWTLQDELKLILPELQKPLGQGGAARFRLEIPKA